ncbi:MAG: hypothetical protein SFT92_02100 [Rickettsiales bacterium]|nr:hypothetical protein [Rickettsiales bacterium]
MQAIKPIPKDRLIESLEAISYEKVAIFSKPHMMTIKPPVEGYSADTKPDAGCYRIILSPEVTADQKAKLVRRLEYRFGEKSLVDASSDNELWLNAKRVEAVLRKSVEPAVKALFEEWANECRVMQSGKSLDMAQRVAVSLGAESKDGSYFDIELLRKLKTYRHSGHLRDAFFFPVVGKSLEQHPELIDQLVDELDRLGIRRVSYKGFGYSCFAFAGSPDDEGKQQIVVLSPPAVKWSGHPLVVSAKEVKTLAAQDGSGDAIKFRVTPALRFDKRIGNEFAIIEPLLAQSFVRLNDVDERNTGYYDYTDKDGVAHTLPMLLDWDCAHPDPQYFDNFFEQEAIRQHWQTMPELQPWRDAQAHMQEHGLENTISREDVEDRKADVAEHEPGQKSATMELADRGFYPDEIRELMSSTYAQGGAADFRKRLLAEADKVDPSGYVRGA